MLPDRKNISKGLSVYQLIILVGLAKKGRLFEHGQYIHSDVIQMDQMSRCSGRTHDAPTPIDHFQGLVSCYALSVT